ncbi:hypothetical protein [Paenibacillus chibensis]|uniref:hypothetical protein n=1 Tax=Paenibacillus chibensis TaxID=59846 RepID=UPI000FD9FF03|nr:hypothetical protein [Paenibacillus chibensis]MEC0371696.1 hypothetical protein [Paenibacillus chibensis]
MKVQQILKRTALSAVMLSAVAAPAITNADSSQKAEAVPAVKTEAAMAVATAVSADAKQIQIDKILDPVELARQYAPETVSDWQETMKHFSKSITLKATKDETTPMASVEIQDGDVKGETKLIPAVKAVTAVKLDTAKAKDFAKTEIAEPAAENFAKAVRLDMISVPAAVAVPAATWVPGDGNAKTVAVSLVTASSLPEGEHDAFGNAWTALSKAEESKDAAAIKEALAELLKQYKQMIADEAADK